MSFDDLDVDRLPAEDTAIRSRYAFVTDLDETEQQVARCNPGDRWEVGQLTTALRGGCQDG